MPTHPLRVAFARINHELKPLSHLRVELNQASGFVRSRRFHFLVQSFVIPFERQYYLRFVQLAPNSGFEAVSHITLQVR